MLVYLPFSFSSLSFFFKQGIDVQDIEHVIFYNHPKMVSDFVQMAGRGGRDGSQCIVTVLVPYTSAPESSESRDRALENLRALPPSAEELLRHFQSKTAGGDGHITSNGFGSDNDDDNNNNSNTNNNKNNSSSKNKNKSKYKNNDNESGSGSEIDDDRDDSTFRPGSKLVRHRTRSYQLRSPSQSQGLQELILLRWKLRPLLTRSKIWSKFLTIDALEKCYLTILLLTVNNKFLRVLAVPFAQIITVLPVQIRSSMKPEWSS